MGAAAGHIHHLTEDLSITFKDIKDILSNMASGTFACYEKFDGMNLVFTYDVLDEKLYVARNAGDIASKGMDREMLALRFAGRGNVAVGFLEAYNALEIAISAMTNEEKLFVFGPGSYKWYSVEAIHFATTNTIKYDGNHIVFHNWPTFDKSLTGIVTRTNNLSGINALKSCIERMHSKIREQFSSFDVHGPASVKLNVREDVFVRAWKSLETILKNSGLSENSMLCDYVRSCCINMFPSSTFGVGEYEQNELADKLSDSPGAKHANDIKKMFPKKHLAEITRIMQKREQLQKMWLKCVVFAINDVAIECMRGVPSLLIKDSESEVKRLKTAVADAIKQVNENGTDEARLFVNEQLSLMGGLDNIVSPMEGVVFMHNHNMYKITSAFAYAHQIIALLKYGRKGM